MQPEAKEEVRPEGQTNIRPDGAEVEEEVEEDTIPIGTTGTEAMYQTIR